MTIASLGDYIGGQWTTSTHPDGELLRYNPADPQQLLFDTSFSHAHLEQAIEAAAQAQPAWEALGFERRREHMLRFADALDDARDSIARRIALEVGKPLWEANTEAGALPAKIRLMASEGWQHTATQRPLQLDGLVQHRPLGCLAVLGPFNFPLHLPNGHIAPALLTGNTVLVKPSEKAPGCMQEYFRCAHQAGLPPGTLNLLQGDGSVGAALAAHEQIDGVLFTGSYHVGLAIKRATLTQHWKLLALEMGGKNSCIVLDDADLDRAAFEILQAAFLTTGQRCSATSRVIIHRSRFDDLAQRLEQLAARITYDDPLAQPQPFMGPLVSQGALDKYLRAQQDDEQGNLRTLLTGGRDPDRDGFFARPAIWIADALDPNGSHQSQEIFGPDLVLYAVDDDQQAITYANATEFGLAMSVFTRDVERFERLSYKLDCGILNLNRSTVGASSRLPFGGVKKSGNHRPSAITAGLYCSYPQAQLRQSPDWDPQELLNHPLDLLAPTHDPE